MKSEHFLTHPKLRNIAKFLLNNNYETEIKKDKNLINILIKDFDLSIKVQINTYYYLYDISYKNYDYLKNKRGMYEQLILDDIYASIKTRKKKSKNFIPLIKNQNFEFSDSVNYDYDTIYYCEESNCNEEGICRCSTIENIRVTKYYPMKLTDEIIGKQCINDMILRYCIERYCQHKISIKDIEIEKSSGYYGEEISSILINEKHANILEKMLEEDPKISLRNCLIDEYGYFLPQLENLNPVVKNVDIDNIDIPNKKHAETLNSELYSNQPDFKLPIAICQKVNYKYRLIDGYHRISDFKRYSKSKILKIISYENL